MKEAIAALMPDCKIGEYPTRKGPMFTASKGQFSAGVVCPQGTTAEQAVKQLRDWLGK